MLGDELSRESQFLLQAAHISFVLPPDVYAIAQGEQDGSKRYCYFVTAASGKNVLVGCPGFNEDVAEALDSLGGIDLLLNNEGSKDTDLWKYEFDCDIIGKGGKPGLEPLADDLTLLRFGIPLLIYAQHGGVLFCGDMLTTSVNRRLSGKPDAQIISVLQAYPIAAVLTSLTKGGFITEGGIEMLAKFVR